MTYSHLNAMSFMHPRTQRSAVLARRTSCCSRSPNVAAGRSSRRSSRPIRPVTSWCVARRLDAVTSASKIVKSVATWVTRRHLRRSNHSRFAYQSSRSRAGAGSATGEPITTKSFLVHRRITGRSYGAELGQRPDNAGERSGSAWRTGSSAERILANNARSASLRANGRDLGLIAKPNHGRSIILCPRHRRTGPGRGPSRPADGQIGDHPDWMAYLQDNPPTLYVISRSRPRSTSDAGGGQ
jgi:hypothetical protein